MHAFWIASGIAVWAFHFTVIYGFAGLACARGYGHAVPAVVALASLVAALLTLGIMVKGYRARAAFTEWMMTGVAAAALIAIVYEATAGLLSPPCG